MPWHFTDLATGNKVELTAPLLMTLGSTWAGSLCVGTTIGYTTAALTSLAGGSTGHKFDTALHGVWFVTLLHVGAITGCIIAALVGQSMGRRFALLASALGYFAGYGIMSVARSDYLVLFGRFLTGVATGMVSLCSPSFLAEITLPEQRGTAGGILQVCLTIGILYANVMGRYLNWDGLAFLTMAAAIPLVAACQFAVESPRWLMLQGRKAEAIEVLGKLRGPAAKLDREWADMETVYATVPTPPGHILMAMLVHFIQQFSGINPVLFFSQSIFDEAGLVISGQDTSIILSGFLVASTAAGVKLMTVFSRKRLLTVSAYTCAFAMILIATLFQLSIQVDETDPNAPILLHAPAAHRLRGALHHRLLGGARPHPVAPGRRASADALQRSLLGRRGRLQLDLRLPPHLVLRAAAEHAEALRIRPLLQRAHVHWRPFRLLLHAGDPGPDPRGSSARTAHTGA
ncbi:hypothetical protein HPB51_003193 [Rhipicephalus microplus]|uniref:Major facilitator superfamily (MFS) profile domain-containing protein n=1 Tax=Rhipicephalus microplus TaxID=6941 RepID=A0A9J6EKP3_RHIMP|nr:hypothetical protein HPB51_003193 [Rhipicephalus microplus]